MFFFKYLYINNFYQSICFVNHVIFFLIFVELANCLHIYERLTRTNIIETTNIHKYIIYIKEL